ncbi:uncharacterized protein CLUP02_00931 [Colletotrichum lupini]|uniref:Uncharacterized protein n=1 Tax=Colletotrichum lupini TaxID=145971 RepID=A0A9Q8SC10_9PEZI|nr:uncharacterized protein CLUP02_00931 [Colletotrichum lupini]UQC74283.1 hypothetical protein CLUP02_00931 [Colletotrichum lupini]
MLLLNVTQRGVEKKGERLRTSNQIHPSITMLPGAQGLSPHPPGQYQEGPSPHIRSCLLKGDPDEALDGAKAPGCVWALRQGRPVSGRGVCQGYLTKAIQSGITAEGKKKKAPTNPGSLGKGDKTRQEAHHCPEREGQKTTGDQWKPSDGICRGLDISQIQLYKDTLKLHQSPAPRAGTGGGMRGGEGSLCCGWAVACGNVVARDFRLAKEAEYPPETGVEAGQKNQSILSGFSLEGTEGWLSNQQAAEERREDEMEDGWKTGWKGDRREGSWDTAVVKEKGWDKP